MIMETLKFKVGDKVRVKSLEWYNDSKNISGEIIHKEGRNFGVFHPYMHSWCGDVIKINSVKNGYYGANNSWRWYDWMLENEVVTEEKQEVKVLNNEMETTKTKEMTQAEIFEYLNDTKILCTSKEESEKVQEKLFELGIEWYIGGKEVCINYFLLFIEDKKITYTPSMEYWVKDGREKIEVSEILAIQIKEEEKPKFDFCTLKPFDKVIVKDNGCTWRCNFFSHKEEDRFYCVLSTWEKCIPYNDETKHLVGTTEDAPEFYLI